MKNLIDRTTELTLGDDDFNGILGANEIFSGGKGDDFISGGDGLDFAVYGKTKSEYLYATTNDALYVLDTQFRNDGFDKLQDVERIKFSDKNVAFDFAQGDNAAKAALFIGTVGYAHLNDPSVFGQVLSHFDNGESMADVFNLALSSGLVDSLAGGQGSSEFISLIYNNIIGHSPSSDEIANLSSLLSENGGGLSRVDFLVSASALDANATHVDLVGLSSLGMTYSEFSL